MELLVTQTGGDLTSPRTMLDFKSQLEKETNLQVSVKDGSRKRSVVTLTLSKTEAAEISTDCEAGQQVVKLSCGEMISLKLQRYKH